MSSRPVVVIIFIVANFFILFDFLSAIHGQQQIQKKIDHEDEKSKGIQQHHRHRWRRAPAVWGEPAPDYSMASLDHSAHLYLYALLFVDLKTSDHYRREHGLVKREVMRLAREANNYFFQINMHLIVVDVLETFRDDLSLYSFEQYRNQRSPQLPFHNFAVLITYRYAGGLAFVGGMCTPKSVMLAGFYPHNPEAMGSIFFHEVAHLIGVPHRPANESLDVPNCPCPRGGGNVQLSSPSQFNQTILGEPISKTSLILDGNGASHQFRGCLKIPGFDQDCTLQLMVNLAQRTRCLAREPRDPAEYSLPLCGNGIREGNEQCDCGLANKCSEWNCEPYTCSRKWQPHIIWLLTISLCFIIFGPLLFCGWLHLSGRHYCCCFPLFSTAEKHCRHRRPLLSFSHPPFGQKNSAKSKLNGGTNFHRLAVPSSKRVANGQKHSKIGQQIAKIPKMFQTIWEWLKKWNDLIWWRRRPTRLKNFPVLEICNNNSSPSHKMIQRPTRAPPPPPPTPCGISHIKSPSISTLGDRPKRPPPPLPPPPPLSIRPMIRPKAMPPAPPPLQKWKIEMDWRRKEDEKEQMAVEDDDEDEWDDYCE